VRQVATCNETIYQSPHRSDLLYPQGSGWVSSENHLNREIGFEGCFTSLQSINYSICSHNRYLIWLQPTFHDDDVDSNSHWASKAALGWAAAQTEPDTFETSGSNEKGAWFEGLAPTWRLRALNVFWAYWCILWLWKNPTLMRFQARHACCSYPEWLPLENNSTNCSMYAMITSVLSNRNHPSFITLLGPEGAGTHIVAYCCIVFPYGCFPCC
jgi:hypothetical protein